MAIVGMLAAPLAGALAPREPVVGPAHPDPSRESGKSVAAGAGGTLRGSTAGAPSAPTRVSAVPHPGAVNLSWGPPTQPGSSPLIGYTISWWSNVTPYQNRTVGPAANSTWIPGLENGTLYEFEVAAVNDNGTGPFTAPVSARPGSAPASPTLLSVTAGNGSISAVWLPAGSTPGYAILTYVVHTSANGSVVNASVGGNATGWNGTGFTNGRIYHVTVRAGNAFGLGPESAERSVEPAAPPSAPRNLSAQWDPAAGRLLLTWSPPSYLGGLTLGNYSLGWSNTQGRSGSTHLSPHATEYLLPVAGPGISFSVSLVAVNDAGPGAAASLQASTPPAGSSGTSGAPFTSSLGVGLVLLGVGTATTGIALLVSRRRRREKPADGPT